VPPNNATSYCPENGTSCFFAMSSSSSVTFSQARTTCSSVKGYVISYGDADEQLDVEQYFAVGGIRCACMNFGIAAAALASGGSVYSRVKVCCLPAAYH
jgi:hypothetical protein